MTIAQVIQPIPTFPLTSNMACCAVGAYIVFRFLAIHEKLLSTLSPCTNDTTPHLSRIPVLVPAPAKGPQLSILSIGGLSCASCASDVQNIINNIDGVSKATVSYALLRAQVEYNNLVTEASIVDEIRSAGYHADPIPAFMSQGWSSIMPIVQTPLGSRKDDVITSQRAFIVSTAASSIFYTSRSVSTMWPFHPRHLDWISYLCVALSLLASWQIHSEAINSAWYRRKPNMATLASLGIAMALMQGIFGGSDRALLSCLETLPVLSTSVLGSRLLKATLSQRNRAFASPLSRLVPAKAKVCSKFDENDCSSVPIDMLSVDDRVIVAQGDNIPCDGVVENTGPALITESWINGSLKPRVVESGDTVYAGSQVHQGRLICRTTACGRSTRLGELLTSVVAAELASMEPQVHRAMAWFASVIIFLAVVILIVNFTYTTERVFGDGLSQASALLLAACPCSLSLSIPTCRVLATVRASKLGVRLVTSYARIRNAASAKTVFFDKTGTLTYGTLQVSQVCFSKEWVSPQQQAMLWKAVQEVESGIQHPIARGILQETLPRGAFEKSECHYLPTIVVSDISHELGRGARGVVSFPGPGPGTSPWKLAIGSRKYIESLGISVDLRQVPENLRCSIATTVVIAVNDRQAGIVVLEDMIRSDAVSTIHQLKHLGVNVGIITGDNAASAATVANRVGVDSNMVFANALPEDKSLVLARFLHRGPAVFVGDNHNDILCFASSSFSACISGSDMQSVDAQVADATLMPSDVTPLSRIPALIRLSRRTVTVVEQNHYWAAIYNTLSLAWVLGIRQPSPVWSSIGMGLSSVVVLWNSSRVDR